MTDCVFVRGLEFEGNHGYTAAERRGTRRFRINLTLELVKQGRMDEARNYGGKYLATAPPSVYGQDLARVRQMLGR